jgi:hypothetical protein
MPDPRDQPIYRTFEEFEREELRRADAVASTVEGLFDELLSDELEFNTTRDRLGAFDYADDEE